MESSYWFRPRRNSKCKNSISRRSSIMALNSFKFANTNEKLNALLSYALDGIVRSNLDRFDMPGMTPSLFFDI
jgi:hypothetical protein